MVQKERTNIRQDSIINEQSEIPCWYEKAGGKQVRKENINKREKLEDDNCGSLINMMERKVRGEMEISGRN